MTNRCFNQAHTTHSSYFSSLYHTVISASLYITIKTSESSLVPITVKPCHLFKQYHVTTHAVCVLCAEWTSQLALCQYVMLKGVISCFLSVSSVQYDRPVMEEAVWAITPPLYPPLPAQARRSYASMCLRRPTHRRQSVSSPNVAPTCSRSVLIPYTRLNTDILYTVLFFWLSLIFVYFSVS